MRISRGWKLFWIAVLFVTGFWSFYPLSYAAVTYWFGCLMLLLLFPGEEPESEDEIREREKRIEEGWAIERESEEYFENKDSENG
jgi:hypothetical protein